MVLLNYLIRVDNTNIEKTNLFKLFATMMCLVRSNKEIVYIYIIYTIQEPQTWSTLTLRDQELFIFLEEQRLL